MANNQPGNTIFAPHRNLKVLGIVLFILVLMYSCNNGTKISGVTPPKPTPPGPDTAAMHVTAGKPVPAPLHRTKQ